MAHTASHPIWWARRHFLYADLFWCDVSCYWADLMSSSSREMSQEKVPILGFCVATHPSNLWLCVSLMYSSILGKNRKQTLSSLLDFFFCCCRTESGAPPCIVSTSTQREHFGLWQQTNFGLLSQQTKLRKWVLHFSCDCFGRKVEECPVGLRGRW